MHETFTNFDYSCKFCDKTREMAIISDRFMELCFRTRFPEILNFQNIPRHGHMHLVCGVLGDVRYFPSTDGIVVSYVTCIVDLKGFHIVHT